MLFRACNSGLGYIGDLLIDNQSFTTGQNQLVIPENDIIFVLIHEEGNFYHIIPLLLYSYQWHCFQLSLLHEEVGICSPF